jgi:hypothetical protein
MKYDIKIILKRLITGVVSAVIASLGAGVADPKLLGAAALAGGAAAFGIDVQAFHGAKAANSELRQALRDHEVPEVVINKVTAPVVVKPPLTGNVG